MTKISGYEDCHIVNGGEIRQGDASTRKDEGVEADAIPADTLCRKHHATTRTKEELVEIIAKACFGEAWKCQRLLMTTALDALIAIGEVRVK